VTAEAESTEARRKDPIRLATPRIDDALARRARAAVESKLFPGSTEPLRVGRYRILGRIGQGGMGVVYRAHDPELARDVAVKLMNAESLDEGETATARTRLVREARAMARLAHPNVLHVYDVGAVEDGVFIAMELVEGESLAAWVARAPRDWRDVLRHYVDAGRGLAAAHAAGVIHRDFKPENVLVGTDGRVRVGDFGLAGAPALAGAPSFDDMRSNDAALDVGGVEGTLTRTGALLGTPKYMAPEQEHGVVASDAGDQFSFCVALYEALYGQPPFEGATFQVYRKHVRDGEIRSAPEGTKVPKWICDEIVRGLAVDPKARHPSMDALLDALARALVDSRATQRSWFKRLAIVAPIVIAAVAVGVVLGAQNEPEEVVRTEIVEGPTMTETVLLPGQPVPVEMPQPNAAAVAPKITVPAEPKPSKPASKPRENAASEGTRKGAVCYVRGDRNVRFAQGKKPKARFVRDPEDGTCWECTEKPPKSVQLNYEGCAVFRKCSKVEDTTKCPG
jgi:tRNA A-37 threonylcarbamoyl transferase component Bud32